MKVTNIQVAELDNLAGECDSLRAEMGIARKIVKDAKKAHGRNPSLATLEDLRRAETAYAQAEHVYAQKAKHLFALAGRN